jgi:hypothetical protein
LLYQEAKVETTSGYSEILTMNRIEDARLEALAKQTAFAFPSI